MTATRQPKLKDSDKALVRRFARKNDGEAFSLLMDRYADMVYSTSWRILRDDTLAADAVQETFFQLAQNAEKVTGCLGSWLHRVATRRAVDLIRQNVSRRDREQNYALETDGQAGAWADVEPAVDEALEQLPENLRQVLLLHFLQGRSTVQIAADQGLSQPTISRRLAEALEMLRQKLRDRGVIAGAAPLQAILLNSNQVAPEAVRAVLGKVALAKAASANAVWILGKFAPGAALGVKFALAMTGAGLVTGTIWLNRTEGPSSSIATSYPPHVAPAEASPTGAAGNPGTTVPLTTLAAIDSSQLPLTAPTLLTIRDARACDKKRLRPYTILLPGTNVPPKSPLPKPAQANLPRQARTADLNAGRESVGNRGYVAGTRYGYSRLGRLAVWISFRPSPIPASPASLLAFQNGVRGTRAIELNGPPYPGMPQSPDNQRGRTNGISNEKVLVRNPALAFAPARNPAASFAPEGTVGVRRTALLNGP